MWTFIGALIVYYVLHSLLAAQSVKQRLSAFIPERFYRLFYNIVAILLLIPLWYFYRQLPSRYVLDLPIGVSVIGLVILVIGLVLLYRSMRQYDGGEFSGLSQLRSNTGDVQTELKTEGLNRYVRHPLYFSSLLIVWGAVLIAPKTTHLAIAIITSLYLVIGSRLEEEKLCDYFGESYRQYQKEVPMLIPFLGSGTFPSKPKNQEGSS